ncbi:MAG TPA: endonuclease III [Anaerohalosphaeraceae bacterium]|nr:endonuclease III [Phycisphaerae bacterium]HOL31370.1 endonuclease III [Anaerohalosphaeraceae bacterium]HOM76332.1 endonuclease III [Anaerohalosphaeraceae bacterium]HPC64049.1 endonuclease III [Anaerohalosphaeraceae bacterium]HPO70269.1 endonuclease III [Anaerohalosphaeraceae bacterium]
MAKAKQSKLAVDPAQAKERVLKILPILKKTYPDAKIALNWDNPWNLWVAVVLSAQCTDARVNIVTKDLFKKYKGPEDYLKVTQEELEQDIRSTGFFRNKAKNIRAAAKKVLADFGGQMPRTMDELLTLPGTGRKTANCVLANAFGIPAVMCDTHVIRLSRRLGLSRNSDPVKLEFDLMEIVPKTKLGGWTMFSHYLIWHGRTICTARKPDCPHCPIADCCPSANNPDLW